MGLLLGLAVTAGGAAVCGALVGWGLHHGQTTAATTAAWLEGWNERGDIDALKQAMTEP